MSTVFSFTESANAMERIDKSRKAIREVFTDCDAINRQLEQNLVTDSVSSDQNIAAAAQETYNSLKRHFDEFETLILDNEQNILRHSENMQAAQKASTSAMQEAQSNQNLQ